MIKVNYFIAIVIWILILITLVSKCTAQQTGNGGKKKYQQEVRSRSSPPTSFTTSTKGSSSSNNKAQQQSGDTSKSSSATTPAAESVNSQSQSQQQSTSTTNNNINNNKLSCPGRCPVSSNVVKVALEKFWENDLLSAYTCACNGLLVKSTDDVAKAILYSLRPAKAILPSDYDLSQFEPPSADSRTSLKNWEILGPINVGKMELDADPTFLFHEFHNSFGRHQHNYGFQNFDPIGFILSMSSENTTVYSDMLSEGKIGWKRITAKTSGQVDIQFNLPWNDLAQGLSTASVLEYQAWTRTVTHVKSSGSYIFECQGPHTAYIRNDNVTKLLVGDVYRNQQIRASVDLKAGLVGIVIPHRVVVQSAFACSLSPAGTSVIAYPAQSVPNAVEFASTPGKGLLLSTVFAIPVHNIFSHSITVEFGIEKPVGQEGDFFIREAKHLTDTSPLVVHTTIAPGQTISIPLEITSTNLGIDANNNNANSSPLLYVACKENRPFQVIINPSKGGALKVPVEFKCRKWTQSFLMSYVDHDDSIAEAAVILPLDFHTSSYKSHLSSALGRQSNHKTTTATSRTSKKKKDDNAMDQEKTTCDASIDGTCTISMFNVSSKASAIEILGYPILLTLHGSGIPASNHADAYKMIPPGWKDYIFGVEGYYVLAPSRFGAHNWEGVGHLSALTAMKSLHYLINHRLSSFVRPGANIALPKVYLENGIIAGHSMGGHGAWMTAVNSPNRFICAAPGAGWIKKEEYSNSNEFFSMDIASSFVDPDLKRVLERSLSEYHVDRLVSNLQSMKVHIRVGTHDNTVHPWYSRRMHRLLLQHSISSTLEEPMGKQHWWWDTHHENDGGVVNDEVMRQFYLSCLNNHYAQTALMFNFSSYSEISPTDSESSMKFRRWLLENMRLNSNVEELPGLDKTKGNSDITRRKSHDLHGEHLQALLLKHECERNLKLSVVNPSQHEGYCGIQILQQHRTLQLASIDVQCNHFLPQSESSSSATGNENGHHQKICHITTSNVKRFTIDYTSFGSTLFDVDHLLVNNHPVNFNRNSDQKSALHICQPRTANAELCENPEVHPLKERTLLTYGPVRQVYSRPFYIVYGTPQNQVLRLAMRDYAVYLGNSFFASHHNYVQVLSDLEFRSGNYMKKAILSNIMFIGDTQTNKLLRSILSATTGAYSQPKQGTSSSGSKTASMQGLIPEDLELLGYSDDPEINSSMEPRKRPTFGKREEENAEVKLVPQGFRLANYTFSQRDDGIIFTFPLYRPSQDSSVASFPSRSGYRSEVEKFQQSGVALGVCIHANSAEGYVHLSRIAWPVIPPMVRAPFANYIPDFMVIGKDIWGKGPGGIHLAGFWNSDWRFEEADTFIGSHLLNY